jgi:molybdopterin-guanine dinucleotide biosynthesis protein A
VEDHRSEVRAAILAGGRASRLGGEKAAVELAGRPLISYPLEAARMAGLEPFAVTKPDSRLPDLDCEVVHEPPEPSHPLVGAIAALDAAPDRVLLLGCDMPFLTGELIGWLASLEAPAVASVAGRLEPFIGIYDAGAADGFEHALAAEDSLQRAVAGLEPRLITESELGRFGSPERLAFNVNSPDDLLRAERMMAG